MNYSLLSGFLMLCGDISSNPGPFDLRASINGTKGILVRQWNIQRLTDSKFEEISLSLIADNNSSIRSVDVLFLTETFCSSKTPDLFLQIPGYVLFRKDRVEKMGGGVIAYVNDNLQAKIRSDLMSADLEVLWLEISPFKRSI